MTTLIVGCIGHTVDGTLPPVDESEALAISKSLPSEAVSNIVRKSDRLWSYTGPMDPEKLNKRLKGPLAGKADLINKISKEYDINSAWFTAIIANESGWGAKHINRYNFGGIRGRLGYKRFKSTEDGLRAQADLLSRKYKDMNLKRMQVVYGGGTKGWHKNVSYIYDSLKDYIN